MRICSSSDIAEGGKLVVALGSRSVGIFRLPGGILHAYENVCPHQGGPVCQGTILPRVVEELSPSQASTGFRFEPADMHIVCPWHGFEFSIATGKHAAASSIQLRRVAVRETNGEVCVD
jgi:nitrite reductase/ring-hydroxylating ferredoxin subunit